MLLFLCVLCIFQSYSRSGSFGSAYSLDVLHPKTTPETKLNNNYNKPPNTEHPSKLLTAADHLMYVGTLRKLEQVYNVIEEYAKKMKMIVSQRAHWIEDKHCVISVQLQQRGELCDYRDSQQKLLLKVVILLSCYSDYE